MSLLLPFPTQAVTGDTVPDYTAVDMRMFVNAIYSNEGVVGSDSLIVSQKAGGTNSSVDVSAGQAVISCDTVTFANGPGLYLVTSTAVVNVPVPAAPSSGTRIHRIVARITDKGASNGTTYQWAPVLLEDTGGGTPAVPNSAVHLALVTRVHGDSSVVNAKINNGPAYATALDGVIPENNGWMGPSSRDNPFIDGAQKRFKIVSIEDSTATTTGYYFVQKPAGWLNLLGVFPVLSWRTSGQMLDSNIICRKDDDQTDGSVKIQFRHPDGSGPATGQFAMVALLVGQ